MLPRIRVDILPALFDLIPRDWAEELKDQRSVINEIEVKICETSFIPKLDSIFQSLETPIEAVKVVIIGQDPYPNPIHAMGLAFSVPSQITKLPPSLKNIFRELEEDLGVKNVSGDLSRWQEEGVLLLNRVLTTTSHATLGHSNVGWEMFTEAVIKVISRRNPIGILWGNSAAQMSCYFSDERMIKSPHPSPLSAYRGFFGSKPFSKVNSILVDDGQSAISWRTDVRE